MTLSFHEKSVPLSFIENFLKYVDFSLVLLYYGNKKGGNLMTEFLLCLFGGYLGLHKFYRKNWKVGIVYVLTLGIFCIGWVYDTVKLGANLIMAQHQTEEHKARKQAKEEEKARKREARELAMQQERERLAQLDREGIPYCPRCKSTAIQYVERRKRLSIGRAVVGTVLLNPLAGAVGAVTSKKYNGFVKCLKCGNSWKI